MLHLLVMLLLAQQPVQHVTHGIASYYTTQSSGSITASGEKLNNRGYTCAMLDGSFGSYYLVVAENGRSVLCRLNDRGPHIKGRVIDLSEAAMRKLHPDKGLSPGLLTVKVYKVGLDTLRDFFGMG